MATDKKKLTTALEKAGYKVAERSNGFHLQPEKLRGKDGNFKALEVVKTMGLQGDCRVFAAHPPVLILSLPTEAEQAGGPPAVQTDEAGETPAVPGEDRGE